MVLGTNQSIFLSPVARHVDFGCGRGGDLNKWFDSKVWSLVLRRTSPSLHEGG